MKRGYNLEMRERGLRVKGTVPSTYLFRVDGRIQDPLLHTRNALEALFQYLVTCHVSLNSEHHCVF